MESNDFKRFLKCLSSDEDEASRRYIRLQDQLVGFFRFRGIADPDGAAVEAINRAVVKIMEGAVVPDATAYCMGIARYVALERKRIEFREFEAYREFIHDLANNSDEEVERICKFLKPCFDQLEPDERDLLVGYCEVMKGRARAEHRRRLAKKRKMTVLALRMRVNRLRTGLDECVERRAGEV